MNYQDYTSILKSKVSSQSYKEQLEFAVTICNKLRFEYEKFVKTYHWGDSTILMNAINICQEAIEKDISSTQIKEMLPKIDAIIPDMDNFGSAYSASYALDASASVYETLEFIIDRNLEHISNIATYYTDTIDFKIQEDKDLTKEEIDNHPVMIDAWNFIIQHI